MQHTPVPFEASPLITPERLRQNLEEAFKLTPPWMQMCSLAGPEVLPDEATVVIRVGEKHPAQYSIPAVSLAILLELTRYGNSVAVNTNRRADNKLSQYYLKITFRWSAKDNMPVHRIILNAGPHQGVAVNSELPRDLHPHGMATRGAGKPTKNARAVAMRHAERCAKELVTEAAANDYLENLNALFAFHDGLFGIAAV